MMYVTQQSFIRDAGNPDNIISKTLAAGGDSADMRTDDWMSFYADIPSGAVQYGGRAEFCDFVKTLEGDSNDQFVEAMVKYGGDNGTSISDYATSVIADTTIDVNSSARPWTYQYCTEYGWFQTISHKNPMRSPYLSTEYWFALCERAFEGLKFGEKERRPRAFANTIDQGGASTATIAASEIFFANGSEDPWQWATQKESHPELGQISVLSECEHCGHCTELYTPAATDEQGLQQTRTKVADWIAKLLKPKTEMSFLQ